MKKIILFTLITVLAACLTACEKPNLKSDIEEAKKALVGTWYGVGDVDELGEELEWQEYWKIERFQDGSYVYINLQINNTEKAYKISEEEGYWEFTTVHYTETPDDGSETKYLTYLLNEDNFDYYLPGWDPLDVRIQEEKKKPLNFSLTPPDGYQEANE